MHQKDLKCVVAVFPIYLIITVSGGDKARVVVEYCTSLAEVLQSLQAIGAKWESCADQSQPSSSLDTIPFPYAQRGSLAVSTRAGKGLVYCLCRMLTTWYAIIIRVEYLNT